mmetsp:Transcript_26372/g.36815  ORF Transcript_26372/g.36815 Transcript_26372/m.36815 type:complete len:133 (+) Transcript_26372:579-977(+)
MFTGATRQRKDVGSAARMQHFFSREYNRFYYMSISRRGEHYHLAAVWLPTTVEAAELPSLKMEVSIPLEDEEFVTYTLKPPRLDPNLMMDGNVKRLIDQGRSFIIPIKKWRSQWIEDRHKYYFKISSQWKKC